MIPTMIFDFTAVLGPFMLGAGALSVLGVVAIAVAALHADREEIATLPHAPRVELPSYRPAA
jgi:hypothetical protein